MAEQGSGQLRTLVESRREQVLAIASRHHASRVRLFGSAARGEDRPDSDIDLLVDFNEGSSLFDLLRMSRELEALLGRAVDVVSAGGLKPATGSSSRSRSTCEPPGRRARRPHREAASPISELTGLSHEAWDKDRVRQLATERLLEIIGEAASTLSEEFRARHPGVPWRDIIGLRIVLAHHYHRVDPGQVWVIATNEVPRLAQDLSPQG